MISHRHPRPLPVRLPAPLVKVLVAASWLTACEDPKSPARCGSISEQTVFSGETITVNACFADADNDVLTLSATTSAPGVATVSTSGSTLTIAGVAPGTATVTVTATDATGLTAEEGFRVMVPNRAPDAAGEIPHTQVPPGDSVTVEVSGYFSEPDGQELVYTATASDTSIATVLGSGAALTIVGRTLGTAGVTVTATDPGGLTATGSFDVTVNSAPVVKRPIETRNLLPGRGTWVIQGYKFFEDPDGDDLEYSSATSNAQVVTTTVDGFLIRVRGVADGEATVTVTARDPWGLAVGQPWVLTVGNTPPQVIEQPPDGIYPVGHPGFLIFNRYFRDTDAGEELRHIATSSKPGVATASVEFDAVYGYRARVEGVSPGESTITMTVRDLAGEEAAVSFEASVTANQPPRITRTIPTQKIAKGDTVTVLLSGYFEDPDGDPLTFTAQSSVQVDHSLAGETLRFWLTGVGGIGFVTVTATDPGSLTAQQEFLVQPVG